MAGQAAGMRAYAEAVNHFNRVESSLRRQGAVPHTDNCWMPGVERSLLRDHVDRPERFGTHNEAMVRRVENHTAMMHPNSFAQTLADSLVRVNDLQQAKADAVDDFASGRNQNVHELMITMQKSSLAMKLTTAVRGKVLEAYKELAKMQF